MQNKIDDKFLDDFFEEFVVLDHLGTVAYRLPRIRRFCGHSHISVGLHTLIVAAKVSTFVENDKLPILSQWLCVLNALMHDAHESVLSDIPKPVGALIDNGNKDSLSYLKKYIDRYLYEKCLPNLTPELRARVQVTDTVTKRFDQVVGLAEHAWLKRGNPEWEDTPTDKQINQWIEGYISNLTESPRWGIFGTITNEMTHDNPSNWLDERWIQREWEQQVRWAMTQINAVAREEKEETQ